MITTEAELLASDTFLAFCRCWERDKWCPVGLCDWLLENGTPTMYAAAVWAWEKEERPSQSGRIASRVMPCRSGYTGRWFWTKFATFRTENVADRVPLKKRQGGTLPFLAAVAFYLVNFDPELAAKYPPKRGAVTA